MTDARVDLWGVPIGAVSWSRERRLATFRYEPGFVGSGIEVAPMMMPLGDELYSFAKLGMDTFDGLPGMLADSLPDTFGNGLIDAWLESQGREPDDFNPVERLCYAGTRAMGALEYAPATGPFAGGAESVPVDVGALVDLANDVLARRKGLLGSFGKGVSGDALMDILRVGTSAGGARPKALVAWNEASGEVRSGQVDAADGFSHWLLKFDGVKAAKGEALGDPEGYGRIEYAYHLMARAAGIGMAECRLLEEGGRSHFMARRFDRTDAGGKVHMQSLGAMRHFDYGNPHGSYGYEQALRTIRRLGMGMDAIEEQFRRMAFNDIARNYDDHVKNIAFLMDRSGEWSLSPAYDVTYSYGGKWSRRHQMSLNGKLDGFGIEDYKACARAFSMKRGRAEDIVAEVRSAVLKWRDFAGRAGVAPEQIDMIAEAHRTGA